MHCKVLPILGLVVLAGAAFGADGDWEKVQTEDVPLKSERQVLSPGLFDPDLIRTVDFPLDGTPVDFGLPHEGKDAAGKPRPPLMGLMLQGNLWVDLNGDAKRDAAEVARAGKAGHEFGPMLYEAHYEDGTSGKVAFKLVHTGDGARYRILRCGAKSATFAKVPIVLLDDSGNGRFDDFGKDAMVIGNGPVNFLSRQLYIGEQLHELLVHPAGGTLELRPIKDAKTGSLDPWLLYIPSQKSENLEFHTLVFSGREASFSFDRKVKTLQVPAGAYDLVFGLVARNKEMVMIKSGESTSFTVEAGKAATPKWGGEIDGSAEVTSDGKELTVKPPVWRGKLGTEIYVPLDYERVPLNATFALLWLDKQLNNMERPKVLGTKRFDALPTGQALPVTWQHNRNDRLQVTVTYASGILGSLKVEEKISFVYKRP
ncbi:MAG: hypothetical protein L6R28_20580 [Planctomycetes bacterium]|nr:hypothetical protein [Planctomycetota bacterium]